MMAFRVVAGVTDHFIMRLPEWACTIILLMFGMTLLQTGNTFDNPSFVVMERYADEDTWGYALAGTASLRFLALFLNGTFRSFAHWSVRVRAGTATLCCFAWFCIALGLYLGNPSSTGAKTYGILLLVDFVMALHLGGAAGKADRGRWDGRT